MSWDQVEWEAELGLNSKILLIAVLAGAAIVGFSRTPAQSASEKECTVFFQNFAYAESLTSQSLTTCQSLAKARVYFKERWGTISEESELPEVGSRVLGGIRRLIVRLNEDSQLSPKINFSKKAASVAEGDCGSRGGIVGPPVFEGKSDLAKTLWLANEVYCQPNQGAYRHIHKYECMKCTKL